MPNDAISILNQNLHALNSNLMTTAQLVKRCGRMESQRLLMSLLADPKLDDPLRLERSGFKVYSQCDEDGIIQEIFRRIGTESRRFVEFGAGNGRENNTLYLLLQGWTGLWLDGSEQNSATITQAFARPLSEKRLKFIRAFITRDNIDSLIRQGEEEGEIDLLSVDLDGNDYHVFSAITVVRPRVVVAEFNSKFPPPVRWVMPYQADFSWDYRHDRTGASLSALEDLYRDRGYSLVGTTVYGTNAFFVRSDLAEGRFAAPFTAENHFHRLQLDLIAFDYTPYEAPANPA
jgi:hypothetical protein